MIDLLVTSAAFAMNAAIPLKYTCEGTNTSPPLSWNPAPTGTQSIAVIADDPDAPRGNWVHWVIFNLPPESTSLPENVPGTATLPSGAVQGINDFRRIGYGGPCPPPGKPHRYFFKVFALDAILSLTQNVTKNDFLRAIEGHILARGQLVGTFKR